MLKFIFMALALLGGFFLAAQTPQTVVIAGQVEHFEAFPEVNAVTISVCSPLKGRTEYFSTLDDSGRFEIRFEAARPSDLWLVYRTNCLVPFRPGDSLFFRFAARPEWRDKWLADMQISGNRPTEARHAVGYQQRWFAGRPPREEYDKYMALSDPQQVMQYADSLRNWGLGVAEDYIAAEKPGPAMQTWMRREAQGDYFYFMRWYPSRLARRVGKDSMPPLPERFETFYQEFLPEAWSEEDWLSGNFWEEIENHYHFDQVYEPVMEARGGKMGHKEQLDSLFFDRLMMLDPPAYLKQMVLANYVFASLENLDLDPFLDNVDFLREHLGETPIWSMLQAKYRRTKAIMDNPQLATDAVLRSVQDTPAEAVLDSILAQHRGQVIYLDIWATWCGPCRVNMPHSKRLHESLSDQPIAFVYVCINSEREDYEPILAQQQLGGSHYFLDKAQSASFSKAFEVRGIPHYAIIDAEGKVVERNAERPYSSKVKQTLLELAGQ